MESSWLEGTSMIRTIEKSTIVLGKEIKAIIEFTDNGLNVLVAGGDKSHIGAVAIMDESKNLTSITFPKHKETIIAETWARQLYEKFNMPVVVSAGIHYDEITPNDILCVVKATNLLLESV